LVPIVAGADKFLTCSLIGKNICLPGGKSRGRRRHGANPIAIVVSCHRVIGANGGLTGYGGGLPRKRWLLDHERHYTSAEAAKDSALEAQHVKA
jgi:O-6-methylguanine DNA methyltransferase